MKLSPPWTTTFPATGAVCLINKPGQRRLLARTNPGSAWTAAFAMGSSPTLAGISSSVASLRTSVAPLRTSTSLRMVTRCIYINVKFRSCAAWRPHWASTKTPHHFLFLAPKCRGLHKQASGNTSTPWYDPKLQGSDKEVPLRKNKGQNAIAGLHACHGF